jgi:protein-L-isoaspartate(D-aspartate) O-methyltransferase
VRPEAEAAHHDLIDRLIARGALWSSALLAAFRATPRQFFLDRIYRPGESTRLDVDLDAPSADALRLIYSDRALTTRLADRADNAVPISSSSQPSLMAQMLEDLSLRPGLRVLEIGAGTGYNAALLAHVVGRVISIDVDRAVLEGARRHLEAFPDRAVELHQADGRLGYPRAAPFDRIQVTAATPDLEPAWLEQLAPGGLLMAPLDVAPGLSFLVQGSVRGGEFHGRLTRPAYFMPLRDEEKPDLGENAPAEAPPEESGRTEPTPVLPPPERLTAVPAPWAPWEERRPGQRRDFLPALAFLGWLQGLTLAQASLPEGRVGYGLADLVRGNACWMGWREWRISGNEGQALGQRLWRDFLDAGGPGPTEFRLRAVPLKKGLKPIAGTRLGYRRDGVRCARVWELIEPRERGEDL